uniref:Uncharacterized protein n=1 Tax=Heterorhabditis bacteriophora TaxID=37862 RepID=A0A1I7W7U5_HETBA
MLVKRCDNEPSLYFFLFIFGQSDEERLEEINEAQHDHPLQLPKHRPARLFRPPLTSFHIPFMQLSPNQMRCFVLLLIVIAISSPWVIYRRNQKRKLVCKEETEWLNNTINEEEVEIPVARTRRNIEVDPIHKEPIIYLGVNSSSFIDDNDFDVVSEHLTAEELEEVKHQIMDTCNALNTN